MIIRLLLVLAGFAIGMSGKGQDTIRLERYAGNLKKVRVKIAGKPYDFLFDTGGGETFISPEVVKAAGKQAHGSNSTFRMSGEAVTYADCDSVNIGIGSRTYFHDVTGVWDLMKILPPGLPRVDGVLSLRTFAGRIVQLDLAHEILVVETPATAARTARAMRPVPARFATGLNGRELTVHLRVMQGSLPYWFLFDSGNLNDVLLSPATAVAWGVALDTAAYEKSPRAVSFEIAGKEISARAATQPIIYPGALNFATISRHRFLLDLRRGHVWMK